MASRSRRGCIDCKKAKVKCDEVHPFCGTCKRRGRECSGYRPITTVRKVLETGSTQTAEISLTNQEVVGVGSPDAISFSRNFHRQDATGCCSVPLSSPASRASSVSSVSPIVKHNAQIQAPPLQRALAIVPPGTVQPSDEPFIAVYFMRHPSELVFGDEFIQEMNSNVLLVFQDNPQAVSDSLSAIGEVYLRDSPLPVLSFVPNRKARILARLRNMDNLGLSLELLLTTMLGLCAVEIIDASYHETQISSIPSLMENLAMMLDHHLHKGLALSQLARYFIRALARQDMMLALTRLHPPHIPTDYWVDDDCMRHADRFMGYTSTLMPLLAELSAFAGEVRRSLNETVDEGILNTACSTPFQHSPDVLNRAALLKSKIELWHPTVDTKLSFNSLRRFLLHANAYRAASLLYLHRILNPAGTSPPADETAVAMAYEVMVHTPAMEEDIRMSLWPVFLASCEVYNECDRITATKMLSAVCKGRKTITAMRTNSFVVNRVWAARDNGGDWDWMRLAQRYTQELLPI
ncbi:hypothetical protein ABEF95_006818 [Exophiala dermatitidis]